MESSSAVVLAFALVACSDNGLHPLGGPDVEVPEPTSPGVAISPDPVDFGDATVGCERSMPVAIVSVGKDPVTIEAIDVSGPAYAVERDFALPRALEPGEHVTVDLVFGPDDDRTYTGAIEVTSDEALRTRSTDVTGRGRYDKRTDRWELDDTKADILFFVDQSCSMDDDQQALAQNFSAFIDSLDDYASDWQILVANDDDGCSVSGVLTPATPGYETMFNVGVQSGGGTLTEAGLSVAAAAVARTDDDECNAHFLREEALLHVILVSDEPEQSPAGWSSKVDEIRAAKGIDSLVRISAVAGDYPNGCGTADPGDGYYQAVEETGGTFLSICSAWSSSMHALAAATIYKDTFELTHDPIAETIAVTVDGHEASGWRYDDEPRAVVFEAAAVPAAGSTVEISYAIPPVCD